MTQEIPFDNYNTLDYAMHRHDIERLEELSSIENVNKRLLEGWVLLSIVQYADGYNHCGDGIINQADPAYIMGVPRPQFCPCGSFCIPPRMIQKVWHHQYNKWECPDCIRDDAYQANDKFDRRKKTS